jgi:hypothetical protein
MTNNILQIDKSKLREYGVSVSSYMFMLILMYYPNTKININVAQILEYGFIIENDVGYCLTQDGIDFVESMELIDIKAQKAPTKKELLELVDKLRELFPEGKKNGTSKYWRGNRGDVSEKLKKFFEKYGVYEDERIIEATQKYIQSFGDNKQLMRTLEYFILKDGNSDLATILENVDSVKTDDNNQLWTIELV